MLTNIAYILVVITIETTGSVYHQFHGLRLNSSCHLVANHLLIAIYTLFGRDFQQLHRAVQNVCRNVFN
jgi:hypothetical protein